MWDPLSTCNAFFLKDRRWKIPPKSQKPPLPTMTPLPFSISFMPKDPFLFLFTAIDFFLLLSSPFCSSGFQISKFSPYLFPLSFLFLGNLLFCITPDHFYFFFFGSLISKNIPSTPFSCALSCTPCIASFACHLKLSKENATLKVKRMHHQDNELSSSPNTQRLQPSFTKHGLYASSKGSPYFNVESCNIYSTNFHVRWEACHFWDKFKSYGEIDDVFIPEKQTLEGKGLGSLDFCLLVI